MTPCGEGGGKGRGGAGVSPAQRPVPKPARKARRPRSALLKKQGGRFRTWRQMTSRRPSLMAGGCAEREGVR